MSAAATSAPGASGVVVRAVEEGDMERLVRMLARLSPESERDELASPARVGSNASTPMCWPRTDRPSG